MVESWLEYFAHTEWSPQWATAATLIAVLIAAFVVRRVLLNVLAHELHAAASNFKLDPATIFAAVSGVHRRCRGAYAVVAMIAGYGMPEFLRITVGTDSEMRVLSESLDAWQSKRSA